VALLAHEASDTTPASARHRAYGRGMRRSGGAEGGAPGRTISPPRTYIPPEVLNEMYDPSTCAPSAARVSGHVTGLHPRPPPTPQDRTSVVMCTSSSWRSVGYFLYDIGTCRARSVAVG